MEVIMSLVDFILHIDKHLGEIISTYGMQTYIIYFIILFCETGLVFLPFLPGDSLIFAAGAFSANGSLNIWIVYIVAIIAAVLGDTVNYHIGKTFGSKIQNSKFIKKEYIEKTESFFEKHGGKSIIFARFVPIVRTFAPFVSGIGKMHYTKFLFFNFIGGFLWVTLFSFVGLSLIHI